MIDFKFSGEASLKLELHLRVILDLQGTNLVGTRLKLVDESQVKQYFIKATPNNILL